MKEIREALDWIIEAADGGGMGNPRAALIIAGERARDARDALDRLATPGEDARELAKEIQECAGAFFVENAAARAEIERLRETATEMAEAVALLPAENGHILGLLPILCRLRAVLAPPAPKPAEEPDYTVCEDVCIGTCPKCTNPNKPAKPAPGEGREADETDAIIWMAGHIMGADAALMMRGWLDRYRADSRIIVRDAAGAEIAHYPEESDK